MPLLVREMFFALKELAPVSDAPHQTAQRKDTTSLDYGLGTGYDRKLCRQC